MLEHLQGARGRFAVYQECGGETVRQASRREMETASAGQNRKLQRETGWALPEVRKRPSGGCHARAVAQTVENRLQEEPVSTSGSSLTVPRLANRATHLAKPRTVFYPDCIFLWSDCLEEKVYVMLRPVPPYNQPQEHSIFPACHYCPPHYVQTLPIWAPLTNCRHVQVPAEKSWLSAMLHIAISQLKVLSESVYIFFCLFTLDFYIYRVICMQSTCIPDNVQGRGI